MTVQTPTSAKGVLALVALGLFLLVALFASTLGGIVLAGIVIAVVTYAVYVFGYRVHKRMMGG